MRGLATVLAALLVAGGSGYYLLHGLSARPAQVVAAEPAPQAPPAYVFVPAAPLAAGTILLPEHLSRLQLAPDAVTAEMILADDESRTQILGSVARQALPQGVPIARSAVVQPGERGFLAAVLPRGRRAISITVSEVAGLSGLVMPGDRVDIILTYSVLAVDIGAPRDVRASETVLTNLRVLALDQRLQEADPAQANDPSTRVVARTATLEVTPREAEMLTLATQLGELSLVLNALEDGGEQPWAGASAVGGERTPTLDSQVTTLLHREARPERPVEELPVAERLSRVQVVRGIESRAEDFDRLAAASAVPQAIPPGGATPPD